MFVKFFSEAHENIYFFFVKKGYFSFTIFVHERALIQRVVQVYRFQTSPSFGSVAGRCEM